MLAQLHNRFRPLLMTHKLVITSALRSFTCSVQRRFAVITLEPVESRLFATEALKGGEESSRGVVYMDETNRCVCGGGGAAATATTNLQK